MNSFNQVDPSWVAPKFDQNNKRAIPFFVYADQEPDTVAKLVADMHGIGDYTAQLVHEEKRGRYKFDVWECVETGFETG